MDAYLDTSVLVSLFRADPNTDRALGFVERRRPVLLVSDHAEAEFAATMARLVRTADLTRDEANEVFGKLDRWLILETSRVETSPGDVARATAWIRRLDLNIRAPDAIHVAAADRLGATIATSDRGMAAAARALSIPAAVP